MMRAMSRVIGVFAVVVLALGVTAVAVAGKHKPPATGVYTGALLKGTYSEGEWSVAKDGGKLQIVPSPAYGAIYYPDPGKCDNYSLPLTTTSIPLSKNGKFHIKESDPVADTVVKVDWKGKWKSATKVVGTIKLANGNCKSSDPFTGQKSPGA